MPSGVATRSLCEGCGSGAAVGGGEETEREAAAHSHQHGGRHGLAPLAQGKPPAARQDEMRRTEREGISGRAGDWAQTDRGLWSSPWTLLGLTLVYRPV